MSSVRAATIGAIDNMTIGSLNALLIDYILTDPAYLVGEWLLDEASGTTAFDSSGNGNDGTYTGGVTLLETGPGGRYPWAASFNGTTGYVVAPMTDIVAYPFTVAAWVKRVDTSISQTAISLHQGMSQYWILQVGSNRVQAQRRNTTIYGGPIFKPVESFEFDHVMAVFRSTTQADLYVNGVYAGTDTQLAVTMGTPTKVLIGLTRNDVGSEVGWLEGSISTVRLWNIALDEEDAMALWLEKNRRGVGGVFGPRRSVVCRTSFPVHQLPLQ